MSNIPTAQRTVPADPRLGTLAPCLGIVLLATAFASLALGYHVYSPADVWNALAAEDTSRTSHVIRDLRLPRALVAPLTGASLAIAGVLTQSVTRNRVASPDILGLSAGAALAVVLAHVWFGVEALVLLSLTAAAGALAAGLLVLAIGSVNRGMTPARVVLVGIMLAGFMMSLVQLVLTTDETTLDELLFWLAGGFVGRPLELIPATGWLLVLGGVLALSVSRGLDTLVVDDETAATLGVPAMLVRVVAIVAVSCLTGGAVALAGPVGFIGLIVPHAARALAGLHHRSQIVMAGLVGAIFALFADIAARFIIYPTEAPVGIVTAIIGGPLLLHLLRRGAA